MSALRFEHPLVLAGLLIIPAVLALRAWRGRAPVLLVPYAAAWASGRRRTRPSLRLILGCLAMALITVAAARPQRMERHAEAITHGHDLMLVIDLSTSMLAEDYRGEDRRPINRLEAVRPVIRSFITDRPNDRIGVVVFAGRAYTLAPLTRDLAWVESRIEGLKIGLIEDGTAIGDGLGLALAGLEQGRRDGEDATGQFVVLLTDGASTSGRLTPPEAAMIARTRKIPVYTIGAGRGGVAPFPVFDDTGRRIGTRQLPSSLDVEALQAMSAATGGRYLAAGDVEGLKQAFAAIDKARKAEVEVRHRTQAVELYPWFAGPALAALLLAFPGTSPRWRRRAAA